MSITVALLPFRWETERLLMQDGQLEEVPRLTAIFNACSYVGPWDKTFQVVPEAEVAGLVTKSLSQAKLDRTFKSVVGKAFSLRVCQRTTSRACRIAKSGTESLAAGFANPFGAGQEFIFLQILSDFKIIMKAQIGAVKLLQIVDFANYLHSGKIPLSD